MFRDVFTNKWILGGIVFVIVFTVGCVLWYQHELAPYRQMAAETEKLRQQLEQQKKVSDVHSKTEQATDVTPVDSTTQSAKRGRTETILVPKDRVPSQTDKTKPIQVETRIQNAETADVPVSPHGYGPYPDVPEDYPSEVDWDYLSSYSAQAELLVRVLVKLWTEGEKNFRGGGTHKGKVLPWYHNTIYVKYRNYKNADGEIVQRAGTKLSGPRVDWSEVDDWLNPPPHIRILDLDSSGIDPYQYLDLLNKKGDK